MELLKEFKNRQTEIELIQYMAQLSKIQKYSVQLGKIKTTNDGSDNDDIMRIKGLRLIDSLKLSLEQVK